MSGTAVGFAARGAVPGRSRPAGSLRGYWRHRGGSGRAGMWFLTHLLLPGVSHALGYFPSRRFEWD